ncbi:XRE family transcriptional regulator [Lelliottia amnigena]|nr:XRE family transcriptional regulator [Lelliottia amnigena]
MKITTSTMLANAMRDQRKALELTQAEAAERVGMKQTTVSGFEQNPDTSKLETLFRLLSALDLELHVVPGARRQKRTAAGRRSGK